MGICLELQRGQVVVKIKRYLKHRKKGYWRFFKKNKKINERRLRNNNLGRKPVIIGKTMVDVFKRNVEV